jgi:ArsR family transcriptional regulator
VSEYEQQAKRDARSSRTLEHATNHPAYRYCIHAAIAIYSLIRINGYYRFPPFLAPPEHVLGCSHGADHDDRFAISPYPDLQIQIKEAAMADAVKLFKALADETRLRILHLLCHRELCVCQIVEVLEIGQSKASRHLGHLRNAGLVDDRREGLWMYYSLAQSNGALHEQLTAWLRRAKDEAPMGAADLEDARPSSTNGKCSRGGTSEPLMNADEHS